MWHFGKSMFQMILSWRFHGQELKVYPKAVIRLPTIGGHK
jgi:hypothetical protein